MKVYESFTIDMKTGEVVDEVSHEYEGPVALCGSKGSSSTTTVNVPGPSPQEIAAQEKQLEIAQAQLDAINRQAEFQEQQFEALGPLLEAQTAAATEAQERARALAPIQDELLELELERIRRGGGASPEEQRLIDEAITAAQERGTGDILKFQEQAAEQLREELAPSLGLRPTDTPILDRGARIGEESVRQAGQLALGLAEAGATARLDFPLARQQLLSSQTQFQQQLGESARQFQEELAQQAFLNRLRLTGQTGQQGLGLATGVPGNLPALTDSLARNRFAQASRTTTQSGGGIGFFDVLQGGGSLLGGVGGLLTGIGSI